MIEQILVILLAIIINGWVTYYVTYFKKKGEYKVFKEDIEEITEKVEYVKTQFQRETDKIKSATIKIKLRITDRKPIRKSI